MQVAVLALGRKRCSKTRGGQTGVAVGKVDLDFCSFSLLQYISVYNHEYIQLKKKIPHANRRKIFSFLDAGSEK